MNPDIHIIYKKLFGKDSPDEIDMDELVRMCEQYPYYPVLQYLLAEKKKSISDPSFDEQVAKTAVFFSNPHWLAWLMEKRKPVVALEPELLPLEVEEQVQPSYESEPETDSTFPQTNMDEERVEEIKEDQLGEQIELQPEEELPTTLSQEEYNEAIVEEIALDEGESEIQPESLPSIAPQNGHDEHLTQAIKGENLDQGIHMVEIAETYINERTVEEKSEDREEEQQNIEVESDMESIENSEAKEETVIEPSNEIPGTYYVSETNDTDNILSSIRGELQALSSENGREKHEEQSESANEIKEESIESYQEEQRNDLPQPERKHLIDIEEPFITLPAPPAPIENVESELHIQDEFETDPRMEPEENVNEPLPQIKLPVFDKNELPKVAASNEPLVPIEPLYTVDYFASQGIKLSAEEESKDKLGQKLKSFTEWLKTMKKIHPDKLEKKMDDLTNEKIQNIAEHSNESGEVFTEAMAEVFAKQGLKYKAMEVYRKLSLLNPDKSHYFATKIQDLNG